jgi:hypothetical protein
MIDMQLLNDALLTVLFAVGVAIFLSLSIVAAAALSQRHERKQHVREIEQHLAAVAERDSSAPAR